MSNAVEEQPQPQQLHHHQQQQQQQQQQPQQSQQPQPQQSRKRKIIPYKNIKAHANPLADKAIPYPVSPSAMDWARLFPKHDFADPWTAVHFADVGCGYGGMTVALGEHFPEKLVVGMELREKVAEYVEDRIEELRTSSNGDAGFNIACERVNAMKNLPNFFRKGQLEKIFFLFPDPHFKRSNHRRRIISPTLLSEYAYVLNPECGIAYTITDVKDLHDWMVKHFESHPLFERIPDEDLKDDKCAELIVTSSEESRKVDRAHGNKYRAVFRRVVR